MAKEMEAVAKTSQQQQQRHPGPDGFTGEFYKTYKKHKANPSLSLSQKTEEETLPNLSYKPSLILIPKADKDATGKEICKKKKKKILIDINAKILTEY